MVPVARRLARGLMADCPCVDDAELVLSELAGNAVRYGGGEMTISVTAGARWARLSATDMGNAAAKESAWFDEMDDFEERGWGLLIVNALATRWGYDRTLDGRHTLWAELTW
jgi:serine/threonine-protein kinase RsbW